MTMNAAAGLLIDYKKTPRAGTSWPRCRERNGQRKRCKWKLFNRYRPETVRCLILRLGTRCSILNANHL
jgi:hypothetical protein